MTRRLVLSYLAITLFVLVILEIPLAVTYERSQRDRLTTDIERDARVLATDAEGTLSGQADVDIQARADTYQQRFGGRVVVVDASGQSVADSGAPTPRDFSTRPEIVEVLGGGTLASGRRHSDTLDADLLYVAVPVASSAEVTGAVRITFPTGELDARVRRYWLSLAVLGGFVLLAVAGVGFVLARSVTEPVRDLEHVADRLASGDLTARAGQDTGPPEIRALAESVNEMAARLAVLVDAQHAFVANASHELRTPLTALRLHLENLRDASRPDASAPRQEIEAAASEVARLARLVDGLLGLARAQGARPERVDADVAGEARDRVETWSALAEEHGVELVLDVDGQATAEVVPGAVAQVLDNLLANAIDVAPSGSDIRVSVRREGRFVELHVIDSGPGLSEADREHAFDRFWRGNGAAQGGSGLGLAIVAQLAHASGGDATLLAVPGAPGVDARVRFAAAGEELPPRRRRS
jgi:signal transduction histidine kinase